LELSCDQKAPAGSHHEMAGPSAYTVDYPRTSRREPHRERNRPRTTVPIAGRLFGPSGSPRLPGCRDCFSGRSARARRPVAMPRCFRGIDTLSAVTLVTKTGDFRRLYGLRWSRPLGALERAVVLSRFHHQARQRPHPPALSGGRPVSPPPPLCQPGTSQTASRTSPRRDRGLLPGREIAGSQGSPVSSRTSLCRCLLSTAQRRGEAMIEVLAELLLCHSTEELREKHGEH
jgi:hypothetical protein